MTTEDERREHLAELEELLAFYTVPEEINEALAYAVKLAKADIARNELSKPEAEEGTGLR